MTISRILLLLTSGLALVVICVAVEIGDTREAVLKEIGKPSSSAKRGSREILIYPQGGRIELVNGKVADIRGHQLIGSAEPIPQIATSPQAAPESPVPQPQNTSPAPDSPPASATPPPKPIGTQVIPSPEHSHYPLDSTIITPSPSIPAIPGINIPAQTLNDQAEQMKSHWEKLGPREKPSVLDHLPSFIIGLLLRFGLTIAGLKIAFKYWEMDAFWKGIFIIAGIDTALHAIFELLGPATGGFTTMDAFENGIPGLVMIYTVNRFCFNKRIQNAVITALAVKLVVSILYIFLGVWMLQRMFG